MAKNMLVRGFQSLVMNYEERADYDLAITATEMQKIADTIRAADDQVSDLYTFGSYMSAQLLLAQQALKAYLAAAGIPPEEYEPLLNMYMVSGLQKSMALINDGAERVIEQAVNSI